MYTCHAVGLYGMAENAGIDCCWLAFIPIAQYYLTGKIIRDLKVCGLTIEKPEWVLVAIPFVSSLALVSPVLGAIVSIVAFVITILATYQLFVLYKDNSGILTLLCAILPFVYPFVIFSLRNKKPNYQDDNYYINTENHYYG